MGTVLVAGVRCTALVRNWPISEATAAGRGVCNGTPAAGVTRPIMIAATIYLMAAIGNVGVLLQEGLAAAGAPRHAPVISELQAAGVSPLSLSQISTEISGTTAKPYYSNAFSEFRYNIKW